MTPTTSAHRRTRTASSLSGAPSGPLPLLDFLSTVPAPLTTALVGLAPLIGRTRRAVQVLSWSAPSQTDSWLALAAWWALCLLAHAGFRYALPFGIAVLTYGVRRTPPPAIPPATEATLQAVISDLNSLHALLIPSTNPPSPSAPSSTISAPNFRPTLYALLRVALLLTPVYLLLARFVHLRVILALCGTLVLTHRAPWARTLRRTLWRSAHLRWALYRAWSLLSGQPLPPPLLSPSAQLQTGQSLSVSTQGGQGASNVQATPPVRFLFTLYENQRWWMALDWTAALLPGERPSWCSPPPILAPVAPPAAFALPPPTSVYLPLPTAPAPTKGRTGLLGLTGAGAKDKAAGEGEGEKPRPQRIRRTATWVWEEPEWRVLVRREASPGVSSRSERVERPLPALPDESGAAGAGARMFKAAARMREGSASGPPGVAPGAHEKDRERDGTAGAEGDVDRKAEDDGEEEEPCTDADGWVYGDNKWEARSARGGMGKYTRFRRWTRVAVLRETIEIVEAGELGVERHTDVALPAPAPSPNPAAVVSGPAPGPGSPAAASSALPAPVSAPVAEAVVKEDAHPHSPMDEKAAERDADKNRLRLRLKAAIKGAGSGS